MVQPLPTLHTSLSAVPALAYSILSMLAILLSVNILSSVLSQGLCTCFPTAYNIPPLIYAMNSCGSPLKSPLQKFLPIIPSIKREHPKPTTLNPCLLIFCFCTYQDLKTHLLHFSFPSEWKFYESSAFVCLFLLLYTQLLNNF